MALFTSAGISSVWPQIVFVYTQLKSLWLKFSGGENRTLVCVLMFLFSWTLVWQCVCVSVCVCLVCVNLISIFWCVISISDGWLFVYECVFVSGLSRIMWPWLTGQPDVCNGLVPFLAPSLLLSVCVCVCVCVCVRMCESVWMRCWQNECGWVIEKKILCECTSVCVLSLNSVIIKEMIQFWAKWNF